MRSSIRSLSRVVKASSTPSPAPLLNLTSTSGRPVLRASAMAICSGDCGRVFSSAGMTRIGFHCFRQRLSWPKKAATRMRTIASATWITKLLRFMVVPQNSNAVVLALVFVKAKLVFVGAILVGAAVGGKADAPVAGDHLAAHLVVFGGAERHIGKVGIFNGIADFRRINVEAPRQIVASFVYCFFFCHSAFAVSDDLQRCFVPDHFELL